MLFDIKNVPFKTVPNVCCGRSPVDFFLEYMQCPSCFHNNFCASTHSFQFGQGNRVSYALGFWWQNSVEAWIDIVQRKSHLPLWLRGESMTLRKFKLWESHSPFKLIVRKIFTIYSTLFKFLKKIILWSDISH